MAKIAWIGLGNMGTPMAMNLIKAGHEVTVQDIYADKALPLEKAGARKAASASEAAKGAEFIFTMIPSDKVLEAVTIAPGGVIESMESGAILIDMSTVSIDVSEKIDEAVTAKNGRFLRCPVSGSTVLAAAGNLTTLCSGPRDAYEKAMPLFEKLGQKHFYLGGANEARTMKLSLNMMVSTSIQMLAESLVICEKAGMDMGVAMDVICGSVVGSPFIQYKCPPIKDRDFSPTFTVDFMVKDLDLAIATAKRLGVTIPVTAITKQMLEAMANMGRGGWDIAGVVPLVEELSGIENPVVNL